LNTITDTDILFEKRVESQQAVTVTGHVNPCSIRFPSDDKKEVGRRSNRHERNDTEKKGE
jgi:hypothetical protein